jgi:L-arabinose isomerase
MKKITQNEVWSITGSQHLYGEETLAKVSEHSEVIAKELNQSDAISVKIIFKPIVKTTEEIFQICQDANQAVNCIGIITWMHTFSPAKMWINGLKILNKPLLHLHTQFNRDIPWNSIDMDFMNLNQSAHGDRRHQSQDCAIDSATRRTAAGCAASIAASVPATVLPQAKTNQALSTYHIVAKDESVNPANKIPRDRPR